MPLTLEYFGHSTFAVDLDGTYLIVDPFFKDNPLTDKDPGDFKKVDYILLTHGHFDHVADAVGIAKATGATVIANFEIMNWLQGQGLEQVHPQHIGGGFQHPFGYLKFTIAHHGSMLPDGTNGGNPAGLLLRSNAGPVLYFAGDTALTLDFQLLADENIDVAVLPIGDNFTMGPEDAAKAVTFLKPKLVIPCHYNTFPPIEQDPNHFADLVAKGGVAKAKVLQPGETHTIA